MLNGQDIQFYLNTLKRPFRQYFEWSKTSHDTVVLRKKKSLTKNAAQEEKNCPRNGKSFLQKSHGEMERK